MSEPTTQEIIDAALALGVEQEFLPRSAKKGSHFEVLGAFETWVAIANFDADAIAMHELRNELREKHGVWLRPFKVLDPTDGSECWNWHMPGIERKFSTESEALVAAARKVCGSQSDS